LPAVLAALRRAVDALTEPQTGYVNGRAVTAPGLVDQLGEAIAGRQGTGNRSAARSLPPAWVDATDLLDRLYQSVYLNGCRRVAFVRAVQRHPTATSVAGAR
jgi:hypothetical protein